MSKMKSQMKSHNTFFQCKIKKDHILFVCMWSSLFISLILGFGVLALPDEYVNAFCVNMG
jgi:hypothetical protein